MRQARGSDNGHNGPRAVDGAGVGGPWGDCDVMEMVGLGLVTRGVLKVREEVAKEVLGHNADVTLDVIIEDELGGDSGLVLATSAVPPLG